jgi:hypothetical protein
MPLATETLRLSTTPAIGSLARTSHVFVVSWRIPFPSAPMTIARGPARSQS